VDGRNKSGHDEEKEPPQSQMSILAKFSTAADERSARLAGIGLMLLSIFMFSFGDALGKFIVATYSVGQLLWLRACAALIVLLPMIWRHRAAFAHLERPWLQLLRVVLSTVEVAAFFLATVYLPLADVVTYYLACPIFVTALSAIVLREHVGWRRWSAVLMLITRSLRATPDIVRPRRDSWAPSRSARGCRRSGWVAPGIGSLIIRRVCGRPCPARSLPALGRAGRG
jgi:threonine/homoserine efflux transporter RhtA